MNTADPTNPESTSTYFAVAINDFFGPKEAKARLVKAEHEAQALSITRMHNPDILLPFSTRDLGAAYLDEMYPSIWIDLNEEQSLSPEEQRHPLSPNVVDGAHMTQPVSDTYTITRRQRQGWMDRWRSIVPASTAPLVAATDFDSTLMSDMLVTLLNQLSPIVDGQPAWKNRDANWKAGSITNGQCLMSHYLELLSEHNMEDLLAQLRSTHNMFAGVDKLQALFASYGIQMIGITNAIEPFAAAMLQHHNVAIPFISNNALVEDDTQVVLEYLHEPEEMIRKDALVRDLLSLGAKPICALGDSMSDLGMVLETLNAGGFAICVGLDTGLPAWAQTQIDSGAIAKERIVFVPNSEYDDEVLAQVRTCIEQALPMSAP